jgi:cytochrome c oxidase cbb3-type subunit I/II
VQRQLGVPYPEWTDEEIAASADAQGREIAAELRTAGAYVAPDREIVALIAYLQKLGKSEPVVPQAAANR